MTKKQNIVIDEILKISKEGESLKSKDVPSRLYKMAVDNFGGWKIAINESGLDYRKDVLKDEWTKDKIKDVLIGLDKSNIIIKSNSIERELYNAIIRIYGSFQAAFIDSGIPLNRKVYQKWSKDLIIEEIKRIYDNKEPLSSQYIKENYNALYNASTSKSPLYFGSWAKAVEESGIKYSDVVKVVQRPIGFWTEEMIITTIKERHKKGESLLVKDMTREYGGICNASYKYFGNWQNALINADINIEKTIGKVSKPRNYWSERKIIYKIKKLHKKNQPLNYSYAQKKYGGLMFNAVDKFGSWEKALETAGINYKNINLRNNDKKWNKSIVVEELLKLKNEMPLFSLKAIKERDKRIYSAIYRYFNDWNEVREIIDKKNETFKSI